MNLFERHKITFSLKFIKHGFKNKQNCLRAQPMTNRTDILLKILLFPFYAPNSLFPDQPKFEMATADGICFLRCPHAHLLTPRGASYFLTLYSGLPSEAAALRMAFSRRSLLQCQPGMQSSPTREGLTSMDGAATQTVQSAGPGRARAAAVFKGTAVSPPGRPCW